METTPQATIPLYLMLQELEQVSGQSLGMAEQLTESEKKIMVNAASKEAIKNMITREGAKSNPDIAQHFKSRIIGEVKNSIRGAAKNEGFTEEEIIKIDSLETQGDVISYVTRLAKAKAEAGAAASDSEQVRTRDLAIAAKDKEIQRLMAERNAMENRHASDLENTRVNIALKQMIDSLPIAGIERESATKLIEIEAKSLLDQWNAEVKLINGKLKLIRKDDPSIDILENGKLLTLETLLVQVAKKAKIYAIPTAPPPLSQNMNKDPRIANGQPSAVIGGNPLQQPPSAMDNGKERLNESSYNATTAIIEKMRKNNPDIIVPATLLNQQAYR